MLPGYAMPVSAVPPSTDSSSHLRISLVTCSPGYQEVYEIFGHTAVRVIDSVDGTDMVYNYGTFNGYEENFELKFMRGKLLYYLSVYPFNSFLQEYISLQRGVKEQVLILPEDKKKELVAYLDWNAQPENSGYKYDFFFDNCATRIRDVVPHVLGSQAQLGQTIPENSKQTFRDIINIYFEAKPWERIGVNILLGSRIDKVMTNKDIMFLPDYLSTGYAKARYMGKSIAEQPITLLAENSLLPAGKYGPLLLTLAICLLTIAGLTIPSLKVLGKMMRSVLLLITGLLGVLILIMWFATDHQGCSNNFNILWALPTNLLFLAFRGKRRSKYALIAIILLLVVLMLHVLRVQQLLLPEMMPFLIALLFTYGTIYKEQLIKQNA